jgi:hypothetical protein
MGLNLYIAQDAKVFTKGPIRKKIVHDGLRWWHLDSLSPYLYQSIFHLYFSCLWVGLGKI